MRRCACRGTAGFAHVSCLAEQAKILVAEAEENNLDDGPFNERWHRWHTCSLCEQHYHGAVYCALGWACWKTYVGRPEGDRNRIPAMNLLGNGLHAATQHEDALSVREAELSMRQRLGGSEENILSVQGNIAISYQKLGRLEQALQIERDVYSGRLKLNGAESMEALVSANNWGSSLVDLRRFEEAKSMLREMIPVARRVIGDNHELTIRLGWNYTMALCEDPAATLGDLREAVATFEKTIRVTRRVFGGDNPLTRGIERSLQKARSTLRARETQSPG